MPAKRLKLKSTMEPVVKMRILSANIAKPQREEQFYRDPNRNPSEKQNLRVPAKRLKTPETQKTLWDRSKNANLECQRKARNAKNTMGSQSKCES